LKDILAPKRRLKMCPKFRNGICEVAGIEPEYSECTDETCCYSSSRRFEACRLYLLEALMDCDESVRLVAGREKVNDYY
jgi:hypothetical protein